MVAYPDSTAVVAPMADLADLAGVAQSIGAGPEWVEVQIPRALYDKLKDMSILGTSFAKAMKPPTWLSRVPWWIAVSIVLLSMTVPIYFWRRGP